MTETPSPAATPDDAKRSAARWREEFAAARKDSEQWRKDGEDVVNRFLDVKRDRSGPATRWNLFWSSVSSLQAMLYGQPPKVDVSRRFADADDDVARVAGEVMQRLLNSDCDSAEDGYADALQSCLEDRLLPGVSFAWVRYEAEIEESEEVPAQLDAAGMELAPAVPPISRVVSQEAEVDYVHWRDVLWSPAKTWRDVRWIARAALMSRDQLVKRFGEELGKVVPLDEKLDADKTRETPWDRARVWEIWDKASKTVYWVSESHPDVLDTKPDPLELEGFFPCPRPMMANATTSGFKPRADWCLAKDLYEEIDSVSTRITLLERAIRVTGVYDAASADLKLLLDRQQTDNQLYPSANWGAFSEKGGLKGVVDWMPLDQIVGALMSLRDYRRELIDALYQVTGQSDIMRGQASAAGTSATEQAVKAKFGSVRVQRLQDEFARFASDIQSLKAQIVCKFFEPQTILERSNMQASKDAALLPAAIELLKSRHYEYRIEVKPETVALTDFSALKSERMEVLGGLSTFFQAAAPVAQQMPGATPFMLEMLQWVMAGVRGASSIEGVIDRAIDESRKAAAAAAAAPQSSAPDPKLLVQQMKGQQDLAKIQAQTQADVALKQVEVQADAQREQAQAEWNTREAAAKAQIATAARGSGGLT